jgi:hypothetical protein
VIDRQTVRTLVVAAAFATLLTLPAGAQGRGGPFDQRPFIGMVGLNPLGIPFDIFSIEAEGVVGPGITVGAAGSYNAFGGDIGPGGRDPRFGSGDIKVRYYPSEVAFRGFAAGLGLGITNFSSRPEGPDGSPLPERQKISAPTISVEADYNYLIERFVVGTGVGAKRYLASEDDRDQAGAPRAWAYVRFVLGLAF